MEPIVRTATTASQLDVPGVRVVGALLGVALLVAAIRAMFGKR